MGKKKNKKDKKLLKKLVKTVNELKVLTANLPTEDECCHEHADGRGNCMSPNFKQPVQEYDFAHMFPNITPVSGERDIPYSEAVNDDDAFTISWLDDTSRSVKAFNETFFGNSEGKTLLTSDCDDITMRGNAYWRQTTPFNIDNPLIPNGMLRFNVYENLSDKWVPNPLWVINRMANVENAFWLKVGFNINCARFNEEISVSATIPLDRCTSMEEFIFNFHSAVVKAMAAVPEIPARIPEIETIHCDDPMLTNNYVPYYLLGYFGFLSDIMLTNYCCDGGMKMTPDDYYEDPMYVSLVHDVFTNISEFLGTPHVSDSARRVPIKLQVTDFYFAGEDEMQIENCPIMQVKNGEISYSTASIGCSRRRSDISDETEEGEDNVKKET